jgi:predicted nucleic acid-binding protein
VILYLDASIVVALITRQGASTAVHSLLDESEDDFVLSDFAMAECSAALARLGRVDRWSIDFYRTVFAELDGWVDTMAEAVLVLPDDIALATDFVRQPDVALGAPDAIHIAATHRLGATLLTLDRGMARAAAALGVPYLNPAEGLAPGEPKD